MRSTMRSSMNTSAARPKRCSRSKGGQRKFSARSCNSRGRQWLLSISLRVDLGAPLTTAPYLRSRLARLRPAHLWPWTLLLLLGLVVAVPLGFLVLGSFSSGRFLGEIDLTALT